MEGEEPSDKLIKSYLRWRVEAFKAAPGLQPIPNKDKRRHIIDVPTEESADNWAMMYSKFAPEYRTIVTDLGEVKTPEE